MAGQTSPLVIASYNGLQATARAMELLLEGKDALDAVLAGLEPVEDNPEEHSVGYGGLPNAEGVVELEASCMHGPSHRAGSVAGLQGIRYPAQVARLVMEQSPHVLLVGENARQFAINHGFKTENMLSPRAQDIWLNWRKFKETGAELDPDFEIPKGYLQFFKTTGTLTCLALDRNGNVSGTTTTSGMAFKVPGRVGDSSIIGAGLYVDNEVGACGSTGLGEVNLRNLSCFQVVEAMRSGLEPTQACQRVIDILINQCRRTGFPQPQDMPQWNVQFYALNHEGVYGSASILGPTSMAVATKGKNQLYPVEYRFERVVI